MNDKLTLQELIDLLAARHQMEPQDADAFVREFWALIEEGLKSDNYVKIKGLGTFKLIDTEARESINIQTGERIEIQSHARVTFSPEAALRDLINRPFAHFETVVLNDSTNFDDLVEQDEKAEADEEEDNTEVSTQSSVDLSSFENTSITSAAATEASSEVMQVTSLETPSVDLSESDQELVNEQCISVEGIQSCGQQVTISDEELEKTKALSKEAYASTEVLVESSQMKTQELLNEQSVPEGNGEIDQALASAVELKDNTTVEASDNEKPSKTENQENTHSPSAYQAEDAQVEINPSDKHAVTETVAESLNALEANKETESQKHVDEIASDSRTQGEVEVVHESKVPAEITVADQQRDETESDTMNVSVVEDKSVAEETSIVEKSSVSENSCDESVADSQCQHEFQGSEAIVSAKTDIPSPHVVIPQEARTSSEELMPNNAQRHGERTFNDSFCRKSKRRLSWCVVTCALLVGIVIGGFASLYIMFGNDKLSENLVNTLSHADQRDVVTVLSDSKAISNSSEETLAANRTNGEDSHIEADIAVNGETAKQEKNNTVTGAKSAALDHALYHASSEPKKSDVHLSQQPTAKSVSEPRVKDQKRPLEKSAVKPVVKPTEKSTIKPVVKNEVKPASKSAVKNAAEFTLEPGPKTTYYSEKVSYKITGTITSYTLRPGETLTRVALKFYGNKKIWPYLVMHNKDIIKNPDNVPIGTTIRIPVLAPVSSR